MGQPAEESRSGELLNASYELHELTEPGVVSDSYRATDRTRKKTVQVTLLRPEFALQSAVVQRFLHTGKTLSGLRHPNVSQVVAVESDDTGIPFVVEEDVQGELLSQTLRAFPDGMPLDLALRVVEPIVEAIAAAHALGVVHGQLDGEHVVLVKSGAISLPKVVRFGAIAASEQAASARVLRAPELRGKEARASADVRSDVWAIGALLYQMLCGRPPSDSAGARALLEECAPQVPSKLSALVERCLERNPARRPSRAENVRAELSLMRTSLNPSAPPALSTKSKSPPDAGQAFALGATLFQQPAPRVESAPPDLAFAETAHATTLPPEAPHAPAARPSAARAKNPAPAAAERGATHVERPRASKPVPSKPAPSKPAPSKPAPSKPAPRSMPPNLSGAPAALPEIKTMSDLADAFGPMEGADNIVQSETEGAARARGFRQSMEAQAENNPKKRPREREERAVPAPVPAASHRQSQRRDAAGKPVAPLLSPKQLKQQVSMPQRAMTEEQAYALRERLRAAEPRSWRAFGDGLLIVFGLALLFMMPFLSDPDRGKAQAALGTHAAFAFIGLAVLAITAVVRTSVMNSQSAPMLLGPMSWTLRILTCCTCVLCAAYNFPTGAFGPAEMAARWALPWAASGFYMAGGAYGLMFGIRESASNLVYGLLIGSLFSGGFYASYRTMLQGVRSIAAARSRSAAEGGLRGASDTVDSLKKLASGNAVHPADAGTEKLEERHEVGSSEADDMRSIEQMKNTQHGQAATFDQLHKQIEKVAH